MADWMDSNSLIQSVVLCLLGFMLAIPGFMLTLHGFHIRGDTETSSSAIIMGTILLLYGAALILTSWISGFSKLCGRCCSKKPQDQESIYSIQEDLSFPGSNEKLFPVTDFEDICRSGLQQSGHQESPESRPL